MKHWPGITVITLLVALGVGLMLVQPHPEAQPLYIDISADLAFTLDCTSKAEPPSDEAIEGFLTHKGFRVLDKLRLARKYDPDYHRMTMDITGIDSAHRKIYFTADPDEPRTYSVALYSEPPTQHSTELEGSLLGFTEKTLGCRDRQVERSENPAEARDDYDFSFSQIEDSFQQAAGS
jgi:hypothetical protein